MKMLVFVNSGNVPLTDLYNPEGLPILRQTAGSTFASEANAKENELFLVEKVTGNMWRVIRRIRYPYTAQQYESLISEGSQSGQGQENKPVLITGEGEKLGFGLNPFSMPNIIPWILFALLGYMVLKDEL